MVMKRFYLFLLCLFTLHVAGAQEQYQEEKAKIKEIKLSGNYYYADVVMDKLNDARELALQNLVLAIQSDLSVGKEIIPRIKEKWQHIALTRENKQRVFGYIYKGDVDEKFAGQKAGAGVTAGKEPEKEPEAKKDTLAVVPGKEVTVDKDAAVGEEREKEVAEVKEENVADAVKEVERQRVTDTVVLVQKDTVVITRRDTVVVREIVKEEAPRGTGNAMLDKILTFRKVDELQRYFAEQKEKGKLMFGKLSSVVTPEQCYMVVFSRSGEVTAILGKGTTTRRNLTKGTDGDRLENYPNQGKVWFQLY